jgi:hypothetical protein
MAKNSAIEIAKESKNSQFYDQTNWYYAEFLISILSIKHRRPVKI